MRASLTDMVTSLAARDPDKLIYTFLHADRPEEKVTAAELHADACRTAALLHQHGVRAGEILPLVFDHGYALVAAFWGAIYLDAVPTILPYLSRQTRSESYLQQVSRLVRFAGAPAIVSTGETAAYLRAGLGDDGPRVVSLPESLRDAPEPPPGVWPVAAPSDPPYIQFSSGTTGLPKGVIVTHAAVASYCHISNRHFATTPADRTVGWLPLYHDMGLINQVLEPLSWARHSVLMSPAAWLSDPSRLPQAIDRFRGTITWMPNFGLRYCVRRIRDDQLAGVDLSSWRIVGNASEPVRVEDLQAFAERFAPYGLRPTALTVSYGMAEHVAGMTWTEADRAPAVDWVCATALQDGRALRADPQDVRSRPIVSCGRPLEGATVRIVDDAGIEMAEREVGEILVHGPLVFKGYHLMADESAAAIRDGWLRTGDLGYLADGELYVCGRKKDLIIVGGRNVLPHQLEAVVAEVLGAECRMAAAVGIPNPQLGTEVPVVICELRRRPDAPTAQRLQREVREKIAQVLGVFVGDVHLVDSGWIIRTTSGKISRAANRGKYLAERHTAEPAAGAAVETAACGPAANAEQRLMRIWQALFNRPDIRGDDDFFALGGDSLLAAQLAVEIEEQFQRPLPATALLEAPTIRALARLLEQPAQPTEMETLVPLQPLGPATTRPVFFCVHGLGGGVLDYRPLASALGREQPFYALQARQFENMRECSIEAMAADYVRALKALQPTGPYYLGGYCFGGVVAFEMARQLATASDRVALVAVLEGYPPAVAGGRDGLWREWRFAINFVRALPYWLRDYLRLGRMQMQARTRRVFRVARKRGLRLIGMNVELGARDVLDRLTLQPARLQDAIEEHLAAARRYAPAPYAGRVVLFRTPRRLLQAPERDMGWSALSTEPVDVQMIAGSHGTILEEPHVRVLADKLRGFLAQRDQ
jgi:acyl-CoA synthetase (AMP-forming)/AMP-acid ligase II/thioesterase domain-containing protein/acyl carrier protein